MDKTRAALIAWVEENPALEFHNHVSATLMSTTCTCEACSKRRETFLQELHNEAGRHLSRMNDELQFLSENVSVEAEGKRTLQ